MQGRDLVMIAIGDDRKKNGICELTVAKETFMMVLATDFLLPKNSPYTNQFRLQWVSDLFEIGIEI